jgi:glycerol-3-phosphate O-acyltransferase
VKIVPVAMNYERIFDSKLLSNEMLSGELEDLHFIKLMRMIYNMPTNKLGNVYVKYSEPIDLY